MIALEAWLVALATATAEAKPAALPEPQPAVELLEFIGDWTEEEGQLIDGYRAPKDAAEKRAEKGGDDEAAKQKLRPR